VASRLALAADQPLAPALARALGEVLAHAGRMAARAARQPETSVHEWRKSLRRARALLALTREVLDPRDAAAIAGALSGAQAATSALRDADALLGILGGVRAELRPGSEAARALGRVARALRAERGRARARGDAATLLAKHSPRLRRAAVRYARALPAELAWKDVERGLRASHHRAHRGFEKARKHLEDEPFHGWRKRVKALHYQTELLAGLGGKRAERLRARLADLAEAQGAVTDLMVLRAHVRTSGPAAERAGAAALVRRLDKLIAARRAQALRAGARFHERSARKFTAPLVGG
jgi:CHAD domain-containing protein